ncbi:MAG: SDR family NAD(P)-dependent oxidoreductase [Acidimicrobiia bacterium]
MDVNGKVVVVTGGTGGLGQALCKRFAADGARVAVVDLDQSRCDEVAAGIGGIGVAGDVGVEDEILRIVDTVTSHLGPIDVFHSNAGTGGARDLYASNDEWERTWQVNVMSSVYAARAVLPYMVERGSGYLVGTASGAALTCEPGSMAYSITKHAMLDLYELLAIEYHSKGIKVSCFCPFGMLTPMLLGGQASGSTPSTDIGMRGAVTAEFAADCVVDGIKEEKFLILSHPEALTFFGRKASDYDRWLNGMRRAYQR